MEEATLFWTKVGAIGSSIGAIIGAIAFIIALAAYRNPMKVKLTANMQFSSMTSAGGTAATYTITVYNAGIRPVTVSSIQLSVGEHNYVIDLLEKSILKILQPKFPVRLEQGESASIFIQKHRLDKVLGDEFKKQFENIYENVKIAVRDASDKTYYFPTSKRVYDFIHDRDQMPMADVFPNLR